MRLLLLFTALLLCTTHAPGQSCDIDGSSYYTYSDIVDIFESNDCGSCHGTNASASHSWTFANYEEMLGTSSCGTNLITHGNAGESDIYTVLSESYSSCNNDKLYNSHRLSSQDLLALESWINNGATENCIPVYQEVKQMFAVNQCGNCHGLSSSWSPSSYEHTVGNTGSTICEDVVIRYDAASSSLYQAVSIANAECTAIPADHVHVSPTDQVLIRDWINAGAPASSSTLPVELDYFDVQYASDEKTVQLIWRSASEVGTDRYVIERSLDGRTFQVIGELSSAGASNVPTDYLFTDFEEYIGSSYYRLLIVDLDGSSSFSHIVTARLEPDIDILQIRPTVITPGTDLTVTWLGKDARVFTYGFIVDYNGREVKKVELAEGMNRLEMATLQKGMYYLIIYDFFGSQVIKRFVVVD